ncbi:hypothetical protein D3C86_1347340 [compost metagenome]
MIARCRPGHIAITQGNAVYGAVRRCLGLVQVGRLQVAFILQGLSSSARGCQGSHPAGIGHAAKGIVFGYQPSGRDCFAREQVRKWSISRSVCYHPVQLVIDDKLPLLARKLFFYESVTAIIAVLVA